MRRSSIQGAISSWSRLSNPVSPAESSGSDTPLEEQPQAATQDTASWLGNSILSKVGLGGKRRLPSGSGSFGSLSGVRDTKSRRREDLHGPSLRRLAGAASAYLLSGDPYGERMRPHMKEDMVDTGLVDRLRKGDRI
ncbi:hypothetical protein NLI96_g1436 [Meripilus lineatus]|uniref:Uncharacterized protein n=1 Tax=Meripilus lineatus TaxID=2056292 RepID=A0AAD5VAC4_9APHY|nr:hypothetical protein NLI96_g1436 [Physisporinus lineatus]